MCSCAQVRDTLLKQPHYAGHFLLSFEPLLDKYASNLATGVRAITRKALGYHHAHGIILPMAVGPDEGVTDLLVSDVDGCASLRNFTGDTGGHKGCQVAAERRRVPVVTLRTVLSWLPATAEVDFLKVDIQGMDLYAVLSAGDRIRQLRRIQIEVPLRHHYNRGSATCHGAVAAMAERGFVLATAGDVGTWAPLAGAYNNPLIYKGGKAHCGSAGEEADVFFIRADLQGR